MQQQPAKSVTITADGTYKFNFNAFVGQRVLVEVGGTASSGTYGSGTISYGYLTEGGVFAAEYDSASAAITATAARKVEMIVPASGIVCVKLAGSTSPSLIATASPCLTATRVRIK